MSKTMALIESGIVANILNCSSRVEESDSLKDLNDRPVCIGDTYENGEWFRDGVEILTPLEEANKRIAALEADNADKTAALELLGVSSL